MKVLNSSLLVIFFIFYYHVNGQSYKQDLSSAEQLQQLTEMSNKNIILQFDSQQFLKYITAAPTNYSVIVMFTAMDPQWKCSACRLASVEFTIVANTFRHSREYSNRLFFAVLDYGEASSMFKSLGIVMAPFFVHFPSRDKPDKANTLDIPWTGFSAEALAKWIAKRTDIDILVSRPVNNLRTLSWIVLFAFVSGILYLRRSNLEIYVFQTTCEIGMVFYGLAMVSRQMWHHVMKPPFLELDENGQAVYVDRLLQSQFVMETYIVMVLFAAGLLGVAYFAEVVRLRTRDSIKLKILAIFEFIMSAVLFELMLKLLRIKIGSYTCSFLY